MNITSRITFRYGADIILNPEVMSLARPRKDGVDYFPFDVDFFSDSKVKIVRSRYGSDGVAVYIYLLCEIYRDKGYYLQCNEDTDCLIASDLGMSIDKVGQIKAYLLGRSLFDNTLFRSAEVLSSRGIQRRFQQAVKGRAVKNPVVVHEDFWLLGESETEPFIKVRHKTDSSENNPDNSENNDGCSKKNTTNQSKVNQSKVNQSKSQPACAGDEVASLPDEIDPIVLQSIENRILGRKAVPAQMCQIAELQRKHGCVKMLEAIKRTVSAGGHSIEYLSRVLETMGGTGAKPASACSYDLSEIEALLDEEFYD